MIYTKKANFPYPILMNFTDDYTDARFELDVNIRDNSDEYIVDVMWDISSKYITGLFRNKKASLYLIIKSKDNQFYELQYSRNPQIIIPRRKLCINTRTVMQLIIQVKEDIDFSDNYDLNTFYENTKSEICIKKGNALGFSNIVVFDGSQNKPLDLFERKVDKDIKSDVEISLGTETILITYKNEELQFSGIQNSKELNYTYIYMGLQKALMQFLYHNNPISVEEGIQIDEMDPPGSALELKLYSLMQAKNVTELSMDNMDEVIYKISDNLLSRYKDAVRGLGNAN